ncbi:MAG: hypothetical protein KME17_15410 [Cyanosarcina radialis HA8281-LM2]|nr:hypothetical protein [Cyanosarcina radialis HA8281-LM2]
MENSLFIVDRPLFLTIGRAFAPRAGGNQHNDTPRTSPKNYLAASTRSRTGETLIASNRARCSLGGQAKIQSIRRNRWRL